MEVQQINLNDNHLETETTKNIFPPEVYKNLPELLQVGVNTLTGQTEKGVWLMGALGVLSGMIPNIKGFYDGQLISPNLYVFIVGGYGSGKGALSFCRKLGQDLHKAKLSETTRLKENKMEGDPDPPQYLHFIPCNNSKTGFFELLATNTGAGTLFESEGDTLADALNQDFGNFSDGLRKSFHHEPVTYYRRTNREFVEIESPQLSVILSSTFDQMTKLIPTSENGLFSRFLFLKLNPDPVFKNVFEAKKENYNNVFREMGAKLKDLFLDLNTADQEITFEFSADQQTDFLNMFQRLKNESRKDVSNDLDGTIHRRALNFFRISMILTSLRSFETGEVSQPLVCNDQDFETTKKIMNVLSDHSTEIYLDLPQIDKIEHSAIEKAENVKKAIQLKMEGRTYGEISNLIFNDANHKSTIYRWVKCQK